MLMLSAYLDETGHSKDKSQKFVGVAGLIAPAAYWESFEARWKGILTKFHLPYFHMKDFAHFKGAFKGWNESKRQDLFGQLMKAIEAIYPLPLGSVMPLDVYRKLPDEQKSYFPDPYYLCLQNCTVAMERFIPLLSKDEEIALILSEQIEFKTRVFEFYDLLRSYDPSSARIASPVFRDMRKIVPLQAADIVAYEFQKEFERELYRPNDESRYGYEVIENMFMKHRIPKGFVMFQQHDEVSIRQFVEATERALAQLAENEKKQA